MYKKQRVAEMVNEDLTSRRSRERAQEAYEQLRLMEAAEQRVEKLRKARRLV